MNHLKAYNLKKIYQSKPVVKDISLTVKSGEIVGLLGPNGAGKTTAFYIIIGLIRQKKGKIFLDDQDISKLPIHTRARLGIGYLPQEASIFRKLTVSENIEAILELQKKLTKKQRQKKLELLLNEFHIDSIRNSIGYSLSGGERRRVEIARCLACNPKFILLDEPFAGIDPISVAELKKFIQYLRNQEIGILITDHNVRETLDICQRAYIVNEGEIICTGTPQEILSNTQVRKVYLGDEFEL